MQTIYYHEFKDPYEEFILFKKDINKDIPIIKLNIEELREKKEKALRFFDRDHWTHHIFVGPKSIKLELNIGLDEIIILFEKENVDININKHFESIPSEYVCQNQISILINKINILTNRIEKIEEKINII